MTHNNNIHTDVRRDSKTESVSKKCMLITKYVVDWIVDWWFSLSQGLVTGGGFRQRFITRVHKGYIWRVK